MKRKTLVLSALLGVLPLPFGFVTAVDQEKIQTQEQKQIYGSQIMTEQERAEHRAKMRAAKTPQEREQIRNEHHERMKERAKERGVTLPDKPPMSGGGMGPGGGMGAGGGPSR